MLAVLKGAGVDLAVGNRAPLGGADVKGRGKVVAPRPLAVLDPG